MEKKIFPKRSKIKKTRYPNYKTWCKWRNVYGLNVYFVIKENERNETRTNREDERTVYGEKNIL